MYKAVQYFWQSRGSVPWCTSVHQCVSLGVVVDIRHCAHHRLEQAGTCISPNVGLQAKVPLIAFIGLMHLGGRVYLCCSW